jgi:hypothetical protein
MKCAECGQELTRYSWVQVQIWDKSKHTGTLYYHKECYFTVREMAERERTVEMKAIRARLSELRDEIIRGKE